MGVMEAATILAVGAGGGYQYYEGKKQEEKMEEEAAKQAYQYDQQQKQLQDQKKKELDQAAAIEMARRRSIGSGQFARRSTILTSPLGITGSTQSGSGQKTLLGT